jgi:hypothetical protein
LENGGIIVSLWILTTGNSDIHLKHDKNWGTIYNKEVRDKLECNKFANVVQINPDDKNAGYKAPTRVLGHVYENKQERYSTDLEFPLLKTFRNYFEAQKIKLDRVIILLTDQANVFNEQSRVYKYSPYWQDTCTLESIFKWYFQEYFQLEPEFKKVEPVSDKGLDRWNETLDVVSNIINQIEYSVLKPVYISHQAGTPAISSAVQFVSLNKFKKVKFVLSNQYYDITYNQEAKAEEVEYPTSEPEYTQQSKPEEISNTASEYYRGMQIEKAKQLILDGFPGAALKIVEGVERIKPEAHEQLQNMVHFFNLYNIDNNNKEDDKIENASQRIAESLDLISFFFAQKNYIQGVSLLAAAQETFLKVAISHATSNITSQYKGVEVSKLVKWNDKGLFLINHSELRNNDNKNTKNQILTMLNFPVEKHEPPDKPNFYLYTSKKNGELEFSRIGMLEWLCKLKKDFKPWANLKESELRNQLMHNLRGMQDIDVTKYLLGNPKTEPTFKTVKETYEQSVKQPFFSNMTNLKLPYKHDKLKQRLEYIATLLV